MRRLLSVPATGVNDWLTLIQRLTEYFNAMICQKLFRRNNEGVAVFVGELDVPLSEAISDLKDVGYITFAKPKDNAKQRLYLSRPQNRCFSNFLSATRG